MEANYLRDFKYKKIILNEYKYSYKETYFSMCSTLRVNNVVLYLKFICISEQNLNIFIEFAFQKVYFQIFYGS